MSDSSITNTSIQRTKIRMTVAETLNGASSHVNSKQNKYIRFEDICIPEQKKLQISQVKQVKLETEIYEQSQSSLKTTKQKEQEQLNSNREFNPEEKSKMDKIFKFDQIGFNVDPNQIIDLSNKNGSNIHPKINREYLMGKPTQQNDQKYNRYKIRVKRTDFTSTRYQCFCERQYLSYCAMYQHLKTNHNQFLKSNNRFSSTNIVEIYDPEHGFKIKKIMQQRIQRMVGDNKIQAQRPIKQVKPKEKKRALDSHSLVQDLQVVQLDLEKQETKFKIFSKKIQKYSNIICAYQQIIGRYQNILDVLDIKPICDMIKRDHDIVKEVTEKESEHFPL